MRLLFVSYEYPPLGGGGGVACRGVAAELAKRHDVHVLTSGMPDLPATETLDDVTLWRAPVWGRNARTRASLASLLTFHPLGSRLGEELCREHGFDLVASWFVVPSGTVGTRLARRFGLPHAVLIMGSDVYGPTMWYAPPQNPLLSPVVRRVLMSADLRTAPSRDLAARALGLHQVTKPIEIVPHGIDPWPLTRRHPSRPTHGPVELVAVARLVARKRLDGLLQALATLPDLDLRLTIMGDGPDREPLQHLAGSLGLSGTSGPDRVRFLGFVDEATKHEVLAHADVFVLASVHEGFGIVYLEAMQHGLPIIAAADGGQTDFLDDTRTGRLVPTAAVEDLADAIRDLVTDPARRRRIAAHNRAVALTRTTAAAARRYETLFADLIGQQNPIRHRPSPAPLPSPRQPALQRRNAS